MELREINQLIEEKTNEIAEAIMEVYTSYCLNPRGSNYNTDVILEKDGTIRTHNYFGSIEYRDDDIVYIWSIETQDKDSYHSMVQEGLTEEQRDFCYENNFVSIMQTNSDNPEEWEEYEPSYTDFIEEVENRG